MSLNFQFCVWRMIAWGKEAQMFDIEEGECLLTSGKTGLGLDAVLPSIVERIPPPPGDPSANLRLLLFDAFHDEYRLA